MMNTAGRALALSFVTLVLPCVANAVQSFSISKECVNSAGSPTDCTGTFYFSIQYDGGTAPVALDSDNAYTLNSFGPISYQQTVRVTEADPSPDWMLTAITCPTCIGQPSFATSQPIINIGERYIEFWLMGGEQITFTNQAVPIPAAAWLFMSGILGLTGIAQRKKYGRQG